MRKIITVETETKEKNRKKTTNEVSWGTLSLSIYSVISRGRNSTSIMRMLY